MWHVLPLPLYFSAKNIGFSSFSAQCSDGILLDMHTRLWSTFFLANILISDPSVSLFRISPHFYLLATSHSNSIPAFQLHDP
jgi:hypothetical protein